MERPGTGSGQYLTHLLAALAAERTDDELMLFHPAYMGSSSPQKSEAGFEESKILSTPLDRLAPDLAKVWYEQLTFPAACRREGADVAHVPYFAPPARSGVPTMVTIHDVIPLVLDEYRQGLAQQVYTRLVAWSAERADIVITDSHAAADDILRHTAVDADRLRVVPLAASPAYRPQPREKIETLIQRLNLPSRFLLYLGGFDPRKRVDILLQAFARLRQRMPEIKLVIAGQTPQPGGFGLDPRPLIANLRIERDVILTDWISEEDKPALYAGAELFLFPSVYEGFGLPVLEAISCGTPAIVCCAAAVEVAGPGGIKVPGDDPDALAEAALDLLQDETQRKDLSRRGLEHAGRFSWARTARATRDIYAEVCGRSMGQHP